MKHHEYAALFPMMAEEKFYALKMDLLENGQIEPIIIDGNKIIDGRNVFKACKELKKEPRTESFSSYCGRNKLNISILSFVVSKKVSRDHYTKSQLAAAALGLYIPLSKQASESRYKDREENWGKFKGIKDRSRRTSYIIAAKFGISGKLLEECVSVNKRMPELMPDIRSGKITVKEARNMLPRLEISNPVVRNRIETNYNDSKTVVIPFPQVPESQMLSFITDRMNNLGWRFEMEVINGKFYSNFYGNGYLSLKGSFTNIQPEITFNQSVIMAAKGKLNSNQPKLLVA